MGNSSFERTALTSTSFENLVETQLETPEAAPEVSKTLEELLDNPVERIRDEVATLLQVYAERTTHMTHLDKGRVLEMSDFVTRNDDESRIEEYFSITDRYGDLDKKNYNGRTIMISLLDANEQPENKIFINEQGELRVTAAHDKPAENADDILTDFYHRTLLAEIRNAERTPEQKVVAHTDARHRVNQLLHKVDEVKYTSIDN